MVQTYHGNVLSDKVKGITSIRRGDDSYGMDKEVERKRTVIEVSKITPYEVKIERLAAARDKL